ncbi:MAG: SH3 domain-containing protein [Bacillota bacterium]
MGNLLRFKTQLTLLLTTLLIAASSVAATAYTTAGVNVRQGPWGRIDTGVPAGTQVVILSRKNSFYRVRFENGHVGWIYAKYVSGAKPKNARTESSFCESCLNPSVGKPISDASENIRRMALYGRGQACVSAKIIDAAKAVIRGRYGNRTRGRGQCAEAVRLTLNKAKIWPGGGVGHGKDLVPALKQMGFVNVIKAGMTPASAPEGSILIYGKPSNPRGCRGLGTKYGHVEIKESDNSYLYDARVKFNIQQAFSPRCRPLIGVMKMGTECKTCNKTVKRSCGV